MIDAQRRQAAAPAGHSARPKNFHRNFETPRAVLRIEMDAIAARWRDRMVASDGIRAEKARLSPLTSQNVVSIVVRMFK
jgi:hypothetical protein